MEREFKHTVGGSFASHLVRGDRRDRRVVLATRADDELPYPVRIRLARRRLCREALVDVVVPVEDDVGMRCVEDAQKGRELGDARPAETLIRRRLLAPARTWRSEKAAAQAPWTSAD
jgi:hypothetical protein